MKKRLVLNISLALLGLAALFTLPGQATAGRPNASSQRGPYVPAVLPDPADWPMYGHDPQRTNYNPAETTINAGNVNSLVERWRVYLGNTSPTSSTPDVSNGIVYAGSSVTSGNNYFAFEAISGAPVWSTTVGHGVNCFSTGIGSTAVISGSVLSVGGGDAAFYGLDANTGAQLWREPMNVGSGGFSWASPLLAYGRSYLGIGSCQDNPSVRGEIRSVDMNVGGQLANQYFVNANQLGGTIWNSPALSPDGSLLVVGTGEDHSGGPPYTYTRALVSLDPITLDILQYNQQGTGGADQDYAATPLFFSDSLGRVLVGGIHKNGNFYAYVANNISGGPIWSKPVGYSAGMMPGYDPTFGSGGTLFVSNGALVRAVNPNDGSDRWPAITSASLHGNLAVANGLLFLNRGGLLEIRDETNGSLLRSITPTTTGSTYTGPIVSHGFVYWLSGGWLNAWSLPAGAPSPTDTALSGTNTPTFTPTPTATPTDTYTPSPTPSATPTCQVYNYSLSAGTWISGTYDIGNHCDFCGTTITLPFAVNLYGQSFTTAVAVSKGNLAFGTAYTAYDVGCLPYSGTYVMAPFWVDQATFLGPGGCTGCGIFTETVGTAPNRTFIVEWRSIYFGQHNIPPTLDYEIQLHEGQTTFNYVYNLITSYDNTDTALTIGVQLSRTSNIYTRYYCDPSGRTAPALAGQQLTWTYTPCTTPTVNPNYTATATRTATVTVVLATNSPTWTPSNTATMPIEITRTSTGTSTPTPCTGWSVINSPNFGSGNNFLFSSAAVGANDIWAIGFYYDPTHRRQTLTEHWDGNSWSIVPSPNMGTGNNLLQAVVAPASSDVWVVGHWVTSGAVLQTLVERWDGSNWNIVPSPNIGSSDNEFLGEAMVSANDIWAVGNYYDGSRARTLAEHWDGAEWSVVSSPNTGVYHNNLFSVGARASNDVWAAGEACETSNCSSSQALIEHWDGSNWSIVPSPDTGGVLSQLFGLAARASNDVWAVGAVCLDPNCQTSRSLIEHWDGTGWNIVPSPNHGSLQTIYTAVVALAANDAWATGSSTNDGTTYSIPMTHWDGSSWIDVPVTSSGSVDNDLRAFAAISPNDIWAVGDLDNGSGERTQVQHYAGPCATPTPTRVPIPTSTPCPIQFIDVLQGSTFYPYIRCLACRNIVNGYADGTFRPNNNVTRGQLSKIVSNSAGFSDPQATQMFEDISPGSTFFDFIGRLASRGYIGGYKCGGTGEPCNPPDNLPYFRPNSNATRGQITKIVSNAAGFTDPPAGQIFEDVPSFSTFYTYTQRLASRGVMQGYQCGGWGEPCVPPDNRPYFRTFNNATRGQTAKIVANTFFPDCDTPLRR